MMETNQPIHSDDLEGPIVKVFVALPNSDWHNYVSESLFAKPLGAELFELRNVPFYAKGLSCNDVVKAKLKGKDLWIDSVRSSGGHSTYRFFLMDAVDDEKWKRYWQPMESIGCAYERATNRLFAVDVPPKADIYRVYELLDIGERAGVWGFEEAHCAHPLRG